MNFARPSSLEVAAALDVHRNFQPHGEDTYCSLYVAAFMGLRWRRFPMAQANKQIEWLNGMQGKWEGWVSVMEGDARALAAAGEDVVAGVTLQPHGHIGVVMEPLPNTPGRTCVSAAGESNFVRAPIERSFGKYAPAFWANLESP